MNHLSPTTRWSQTVHYYQSWYTLCILRITYIQGCQAESNRYRNRNSKPSEIVLGFTMYGGSVILPAINDTPSPVIGGVVGDTPCDLPRDGQIPPFPPSSNSINAVIRILRIYVPESPPHNHCLVGFSSHPSGESPNT